MKTVAARTVICGIVCVFSWVSFASEDQTNPQTTEATVAVAADEPSLAFSASAAFMSKYVWRGQLLNDDYVMQPSAGVSYGGLSASLWGNVDMTDYHDNDWEFTEYDWTVGYADTIPGAEILKYSVGAIYYYFPSMPNDADTVEAYAGLGLDVPLSPMVTLYRDIDEGDCSYVALSVSHTIEKIFELAADIPVGMAASASIGWGNEAYNKYYWSGLDDSAFNDLTMSVGFPVPVMGWTLTPSVNYVTLVDSDVRSADTYATASGNDDSDYFFTGLTLSRSF